MDADGDGLTDGLTDADGDTEREADALGDEETDGLTLGETDGLGPISVSASNVLPATNDTSSRNRCRMPVWITLSCAPGSVMPDPLGDAEALAERLTLDDGLIDADGDRLTDALAELDGLTEREADADADDDGLGLRLTLGLGLLIISRTARWTAARSSDVAFENPTDRAPCPAVVSRTT